MSITEQKMIERVANKANGKKKIVILHNFSQITDISKIEGFIENEIINVFPQTTKLVIPDTDTGVCQYIEKRGVNKENIIHLVFAKEDSEAGYLYNSASMKQLKKIIEADLEKRKFDVFQELIDYFGDNYRKYYQFKKRINRDFKLSMKDNRFIIEYDGEVMVSNPIYNEYFSLKDDKKPDFEVFEQDDRYLCYIEICDMEKDIVLNIDNKKNPLNLLTVKGKKKNNKIQTFSLFGNRKLGNFFHEIPLGPSSILLDKNMKWEYKKGLLFVEIMKKPEEEETIPVNSKNN